MEAINLSKVKRALRRRMKKRGDLGRFAVISGVSQPALWKFLNNGTTPTMETINKILRALKRRKS